jgi:hypothetical protein
MLKVVILCTARTGHGVKNHWACIKNKKVESHLVKGLSEQFTHRPIDSLITNNKGTSTNKSVHDSSTNVHVSSEMPVSPKLEQALTGSGRNPSMLNGKTFDITHGKGSVPHLANVSQKVDGQITTSNLLSVTEDSADRKLPFAVATSQRSQQEEEIADFVAVRPNSVNTDFAPGRSLLSSSDHSDEISCSADSDSKELHLTNLADLLDMSYCDSLMIIPPDSPE